jgi:hypothetical protein
MVRLCRKNADVTGGKPIVVRSQSISGINAINHLLAFYDIHGRQREVFFYFVPDIKRDDVKCIISAKARRNNKASPF